MSDTNVEYTGRDNLEVMAQARNYNQFLLKLILSKASQGGLIVDFGAGSGTFALPVKAAGHRIVCVETDCVLSQALTERGLDVVSTLESLDDGSVDYLYSLNVLEHIENDEAVVELWSRKLKPGGQLLVYVPAFQALYTSMDRKVGHMRRYTRRLLCDRLAGAGLVITEDRYADSIGVLATLVYKALDNGKGDVGLSALTLYDRWVFPLSSLFDVVTHSVAGKNVYARAVKPTTTS